MIPVDQSALLRVGYSKGTISQHPSVQWGNADQPAELYPIHPLCLSKLTLKGFRTTSEFEHHHPCFLLFFGIISQVLNKQMSTPKTNQIRILTCKALPGTEQRTNQKLSFFRANAVEESYLQSKMIQRYPKYALHPGFMRCASTPAHVVRVVHLPNPSPVLPPPGIIPTEIS